MNLYQRIHALFEKHPEEAISVATGALLALVSESDGELLPECDSWPPGSGSDYVDEVIHYLQPTHAFQEVRQLQSEMIEEP